MYAWKEEKREDREKGEDGDGTANQNSLQIPNQCRWDDGGNPLGRESPDWGTIQGTV